MGPNARSDPYGSSPTQAGNAAGPVSGPKANAAAPEAHPDAASSQPVTPKSKQCPSGRAAAIPPTPVAAAVNANNGNPQAVPEPPPASANVALPPPPPAHVRRDVASFRIPVTPVAQEVVVLGPLARAQEASPIVHERALQGGVELMQTLRHTVDTIRDVAMTQNCACCTLKKQHIVEASNIVSMSMLRLETDLRRRQLLRTITEPTVS